MANYIPITLKWHALFTPGPHWMHTTGNGSPQSAMVW